MASIETLPVEFEFVSGEQTHMPVCLVFEVILASRSKREISIRAISLNGIPQGFDTAKLWEIIVGRENIAKKAWEIYGSVAA